MTPKRMKTDYGLNQKLGLHDEIVKENNIMKQKVDIILDQLRIMRLSTEKDFEDNAFGSALIILSSLFAIDNPIGDVNYG